MSSFLKKIYLLFAMTPILFSDWEWSGSALDEGDEASKWFTNYLGKPSRLVCFNEGNSDLFIHQLVFGVRFLRQIIKCVKHVEYNISETRHVDPNYASGFRVMFSDGYPFLVVSQESLDSLNERLQEPVPINRFRPKFT
ncbi:putative molybdenum cofactor sulfurase [Helianthus debilis subsp. tardiflorus]